MIHCWGLNGNPKFFEVGKIFAHLEDIKTSSRPERLALVVMGALNGIFSKCVF